MITSTFDTKSGKILLEIDVASTISAQILSMGSLSYDFDQTPESVSIDRVQALYSQVSFSLMQYGDTGEDLWDELVDEATSADIPCKITLRTWEGEDYEFLMKLRLADISMNERSRNVSIVLIPNVDLGVTVREIFDNIHSSKKKNFTRRRKDPTGQETSKTYSNKATGVLDWIEVALNKIFNNTYDNDTKPSSTRFTDGEYTAKIYDNVENVDPAIGTKSLIMLDVTSEDFDPSEDGFLTINGNGKITSPGGGLAFPNPLVNTTINITGASFVGQVQLNDRIIINYGLGYGESFRITNITANTLSIQTNFAPQYNDAEWSIARPINADNQPAVKILKDLVGIEGSVFGTGFTKNFYFNRLDRTEANTVTLDYDMVLDFKPKPFYLSLGTSIVAQRADGTRGNVAPEGGADKFGSWSLGNLDTRIPNLRDYTSITPGNSNASKELKIELAPAYPLLNKGQSITDGFDGDYTNGGIDAQTDTTLESILTANGIRSFFQALNKAEGGISIEFSIMGATMIFPWQTIQFDTRAPEKYRNRQFRPTSLKYNFVNDTVTVTAYQIDNVETPIYSDIYLRTGLNSNFGQALLLPQMKIAVNDEIAGGLRKVATFTLSAPAFGTTSRIFINRRIGDAPIIPANFKILLINPFNIQQQQELTISQDIEIGSQQILVETAQISPAFPAGSYVEITTQSVLTSLIISETAVRISSKQKAEGQIRVAVNGFVTSLEVYLWAQIREGEDFDVISAVDGQTYSITATATVNAGEQTLPIQEQFVNARAGDLIWGNENLKQSYLHVDPGQVISSVQAERKANDIALVRTEIQSGSPITSIPIKNARSMTLRDGMKLNILNRDGTNEEFTVNGEQILTGASTGITVNSQTPLFDYDVDADVQEPSGAASSVISQQAGTIVLKATTSSGSINKLALVRLDATAASGSTILLQANQVLIDGQTTFLNSLASNGVTRIATNNVVIESSTEPTTRVPSGDLVVGDVWIDTANNRRPSVWNGTIWGRGFTVINGGTITTGTINANRLDVTGIFATNVTVTAILTMGSGAIITDSTSDGNYKIFSGGIRLRGDQSFSTNSAISFVAGGGLDGSATAQIGVNDDGGIPELRITSGAFINLNPSNAVRIPTSGNSTGSTSGALRVTGGAYFGGNSFHAGSFTLQNSLIIGTGTNKATIRYTVNTARTYDIPNAGANASFVMTAGNQGIGGTKNFTGTLQADGNTGQTDVIATSGGTLTFTKGILTGVS
jgi:hypothetical protein